MNNPQPSTTTDKHELRRLRKEQKQQAKEQKAKTKPSKEERKGVFEGNLNNKFESILKISDSKMKKFEMAPPRSEDYYQSIDVVSLYKPSFWINPWK